MIVALTFFPPGNEVTIWEEFPAVPNVGDTMYVPYGAEDETIILQVRHIAWTNKSPGLHPDVWHPEITLSGWTYD